ncbi:hypothetical protein CYMTET_42491 [Cymbomonas tetramitiformis]|uniref:Uncharacterized protein n=1 Tax=Cymbomonas tetramitiformis TaxID=36881 RepID=A0AAE0EX52_9CHLO|nr:hypothetical protein CYMTET_46876 [Cymbomonas tetramitiformis]KAK3248031.1 hypothetical protein CYMTET_42491 [Cymbomonas tetramitiformis]
MSNAASNEHVSDPVPFRKGGTTTLLLLSLHISSCLSTASRSLNAHTVLRPVPPPAVTLAYSVLSRGLGGRRLRCPVRGGFRRSGRELAPGRGLPRSMISTLVSGTVCGLNIFTQRPVVLCGSLNLRLASKMPLECSPLRGA